MRRGVIIWILLLFVVILGIAIIDAGATRPVDWRQTYNIRDKIPYGLHVLHQELPQILGQHRQYEDFGGSLYEELSIRSEADDHRAVFVEIDAYVSFDDGDLAQLMQYAAGGGEVFLSGNYIGHKLLDTLGLYTDELDYDRFDPTPENVWYTLADDTTKVYVDRVSDFQIFSKLQASNCVILGHLHSRGRALPNFVQVSVGEGRIYLHLLPDVFANYNMLEAPTYRYATQALNVVLSEAVLFSDTYYRYQQPRTPLRVILTQPGFAQAWYLLLFGLLVLLLFKSKREQRAVKVVKPEPNLSKEFAETIGNMYYENGNPANIIHKKIDYFLFSIRSLYQLDTMDLLDSRFIKQLSLKAGVEVEETQQLMRLLDKYRKAKQHNIEDVKLVNTRIEDYKLKAKIA